MPQSIYLSETAYVSLHEIKSRQIDMARMSGHTEEESQKLGAEFVQNLVIEATQALTGMVTWLIDPQMASRGYPFRKWRQASTGLLCQHEITRSEI